MPRKPPTAAPDHSRRKVLNAPLPAPESAEPVDETIPPIVDRAAPFIADAIQGPDLLDLSNAIRPLVEVIAHRQAQTPMMIAIVGPSGAGKSFALDRIVAGIESLSAAARTTSGPFAGEIVVAPIDAAAIGGEPATAIAAATYAALTRDFGDGRNYSALADEAAHAGADPHVAASKAMERHDEARRRLESERQARDETEARRARVSEVVLFETPGSRVDVYARQSRSRIEARLRRFDLANGDPIANFKDLVRDLAGAGGGTWAAVALRALWAYRSQARLLLSAIVFFALAFGVALLRNPAVSAWLTGLGAPGASVGAWRMDRRRRSRLRPFRRAGAGAQPLARVCFRGEPAARRQAPQFRRARAQSRPRRGLGARQPPHRRIDRRSGGGRPPRRGGGETGALAGRERALAGVDAFVPGARRGAGSGRPRLFGGAGQTDRRAAASGPAAGQPGAVAGAPDADADRSGDRQSRRAAGGRSPRRDRDRSFFAWPRVRRALRLRSSLASACFWRRRRFSGADGAVVPDRIQRPRRRRGGRRAIGRSTARRRRGRTVATDDGCARIVAERADQRKRGRRSDGDRAAGGVDAARRQALFERLPPRAGRGRQPRRARSGARRRAKRRRRSARRARSIAGGERRRTARGPGRPAGLAGGAARVARPASRRDHRRGHAQRHGGGEAVPALRVTSPQAIARVLRCGSAPRARRA